MVDIPALIVIVDDEPDLLEFIHQALTDEGYRVVSLRHPRLVDQNHTWESPPSVFLLDLMLPETNGIQVAHQLRTGQFPGTAIIGMSASTVMCNLATASSLFQEVIAKPFDLNALLGTVALYAS